jgi:hypothetical protein
MGSRSSLRCGALPGREGRSTEKPRFLFCHSSAIYICIYIRRLTKCRYVPVNLFQLGGPRPSRLRSPHRWDARLVFHVLRGAKLARSFNSLLVSAIKHDNAGHLWPALVFFIVSACIQLLSMSTPAPTLWVVGVVAHVVVVFMTSLAIGMAALVKPELRWNIQVGVEVSAQLEQEAREAHERLLDRVGNFFAENQLLVTPCVAVSPFDAQDRYVWASGSPHEEANTGLHNYVRWVCYVLVRFFNAECMYACDFSVLRILLGLVLLAGLGSRLIARSLS